MHKKFYFDAIIVLSGTKDHGIFEARLNKAAELYKKGLSNVILISGVMLGSAYAKDILLKQGIPPKAILEDQNPSDTFGNAFFTKLLFFIPKKWKKIAVVTSDFHINRAKFVFSKIFGETHALKFFASTEKLPSLIRDELLLHEGFSLEASRIMFNNLHILPLKET